MAPTRPYSGSLRRLVLAFDVGTTHSGVAYAVLDPGEIPKIHAVTTYPDQENSSFKIPSVLYYTPSGKVRAAGAEATTMQMKIQAEEEGLVFVEWFKLHLRPDSMIGGMQKGSLPSLPKGKSVVDVFGDFLKYLYECAYRFITNTHANGKSLWMSVGSRIDFVFGHPNGWEGLQQSKMRKAAVAAGLITDTPADHDRIHFVSEGEASLHFCLDGGLASDAIKARSKVMVIDAGGGTVDLSTYSITTTSPVTVEEVTTPDCILQGSTRVNARAREYFKKKLRKSKFNNKDDINSMMEHFERSTKPTFKDPNEKTYVKFGSIRDKDTAVGIRGGQLQLEGREVEALFEPSVVAIIEAVRKQNDDTPGEIPTAFLVGGFAANPWLFSRLKISLSIQGIQVCRPDQQTSKAVAEGAASFFLRELVSHRIAKLTYGTLADDVYCESDPEHRKRKHTCIQSASGEMRTPNGFSVGLSKGTRIQGDEEMIIKLVKERPTEKQLNEVKADISVYRGKQENPRWTDIEPEKFSHICTVHGDTSAVKKVKHSGSLGTYYVQHYKLVLLCGLTEMKAQISWMDEGEEKRGPAEIIYYDNGDIED